MSNRSIYLLVVLVLSFFALVFLNGCSSGEDTAYDRVEESIQMSDDSGDAGFIAEKESYSIERRAPSEQASSIETTNRMVIYNGNISIEVLDYHKAQQHIQDHAEELGGFVVESYLHHSGNNDVYGTLVVRIPQENFNSFLNELESTSTKVLERSIHGNDVTEEYVDLNSRLRSKEAVEERLLSFMNDAQNTEDLLKISNDLGKVQEEIEQLKGRINYLDNHVSLSTVSIHIRERNINVPSLQEGDSLNTWKKAQSLFMDTVNSIITFFSAVIVFVIGLSPIIVPTLIIVLIIVNVHNKKKRNMDQ
ncbi:hypothetical protein J2S74_002344 [Evansella vedderi]|uniref:DUF4349 domain-containing protein n=1 Tax=Evansella vedderi TaxID=38282 RepID=A0ABT9ZUP3_9BACI|nr:DUF4349 domain-containing protein [Evansella vedderi]MDQ0254962.1 hypothetical protein [Evansella vedderi]